MKTQMRTDDAQNASPRRRVDRYRHAKAHPLLAVLCALCLLVGSVWAVVVSAAPVPVAHAAPCNGITWSPTAGTIGTEVTANGYAGCPIAPVVGPIILFVRPGDSALGPYYQFCTDTSLPSVTVATVPFDQTHNTFTATFAWPSAANTPGPWSICSKDASNGEMVTVWDNAYFSLSAPASTPTPKPKPTATPRPRSTSTPTPTPRPTAIASATARPTATPIALAASPTAPAAPTATLVLSSAPITTPTDDQPPLWVMAGGLAGGGLLAVAFGSVFAFAFRRKRPRGTPPSPPDPNVRPS